MIEPDTDAGIALMLAGLAVLAASALPVAAQSPSGPTAAMGTSAPSNTTQGSVTIADESLDQEYGDVVRVPLTLSGTDRATLRIRNRSTGASTVVSVVDADADGRVDVLLNTYLAGRNDKRAVRAADPNTASANDTPTLALTPANYTLAATPGNRTSGPPDDEATFQVTERGVHDLALWRTRPGLESTMTTPEAIRGLAANGSLQRAHSLTIREAPEGAEFGEILVVELSVSGLEGMVAARNGPNTTARFFDLLDNRDDGLGVREDQSSVGVQYHSRRLNLQNYRATTVVADPENDTYYLVADFDHATVTNPSDSRPFEGGDKFHVEFAPPYERYVDSGADQPASSAAFVETALARFLQSDQLSVPAERDYVLHGRTTLPPETPVTVTVTGTTNESFEQSRTLQVGPDGAVRPQFDFSALSNGDQFVVQARSQGTLLAERSGTVAPETTTLEVLEARRTNDSIEATAEVATDEGGFVVLYANGTDDRPAGARPLPPGNHSNLTLTWPVENATEPEVVLFRDDNDDGEFAFRDRFPLIYGYPDDPYVNNGSWVTASVPSLTPTPTPTETPSPTPTATRTQSPGSPTAATSPGVGVLGAVLAVLALALLGARRRRP